MLVVTIVLKTNIMVENDPNNLQSQQHMLKSCPQAPK